MELAGIGVTVAIRTSPKGSVVRPDNDVSSIVSGRLQTTPKRQPYQALPAFLERYARLSFQWGTADCLLFLADWLIECRGFDPAAPWRGAYHGWFGAARIIHRAGGMSGLVGEAVAPFGIQHTAEPRRGDIAVVQAPEGERGAIVLGRTVARHGDRRIVVQPLPIIAAWSI